MKSFLTKAGAVLAVLLFSLSVVGQPNWPGDPTIPSSGSNSNQTYFVNDYASIQLAIDAAAAGTGGIVQIPRGTTTITGDGIAVDVGTDVITVDIATNRFIRTGTGSFIDDGVLPGMYIAFCPTAGCQGSNPKGADYRGDATAGGSSTVLNSTSSDFLVAGVAVGDTITNITDSHATCDVTTVNGATQLTCSAGLTGGGVFNDTDEFVIGVGPLPFGDEENNLPYRVAAGGVAAGAVTVEDPLGYLVDDVTGGTFDYHAATSPIQISTETIILQGYGAGHATDSTVGSQIICNGISPAPCISVYSSRTTLRDFGVQYEYPGAPNYRHGASSGLMFGYLAYITEAIVDGVRVNGESAQLGYGLLIRGMLTATVQNSKFWRWQYAVLITSNGGATQSNQISFIANHLQSASGITFIRAAGGSPTNNIQVTNNTIEGGVYGIDCTDGADTQVTSSGNHYEADVYAIYLAGSGCHLTSVGDYFSSGNTRSIFRNVAPFWPRADIIIGPFMGGLSPHIEYTAGTFDLLSPHGGADPVVLAASVSRRVSHRISHQPYSWVAVTTTGLNLCILPGVMSGVGGAWGCNATAESRMAVPFDGPMTIGHVTVFTGDNTNWDLNDEITFQFMELVEGTAVSTSGCGNCVNVGSSFQITDAMMTSGQLVFEFDIDTTVASAQGRIYLVVTSQTDTGAAIDKDFRITAEFKHHDAGVSQ